MKLSKNDLILKRKLDAHYRHFDYKLISPDPLEFPHRFTNIFDIEISAFISAVLAYGNVKQINNSLEKIHLIMGESPHEFVLNYSARSAKKIEQLKHRFYTPQDLQILFSVLKFIYNRYGSLKYLFLLYYFEKDKNLKDSVSFFSHHLIEIAAKFGEVSHGVKFMFPDPFKGSACKRINLFLRWMVRKDELDFGLWNEISPSQLIIPVDTHVGKICKEIKITKRTSISWLMAEDITDHLKKFDPDDPVKYDFAICHIGMRKLRF